MASYRCAGLVVFYCVGCGGTPWTGCREDVISVRFVGPAIVLVVEGNKGFVKMGAVMTKTGSYLGREYNTRD